MRSAREAIASADPHFRRSTCKISHPVLKSCRASSWSLTRRLYRNCWYDTDNAREVAYTTIGKGCSEFNRSGFCMYRTTWIEDSCCLNRAGVRDGRLVIVLRR